MIFLLLPWIFKSSHYTNLFVKFNNAHGQDPIAHFFCLKISGVCPGQRCTCMALFAVSMSAKPGGGVFSHLLCYKEPNFFQRKRDFRAENPAPR